MPPRLACFSIYTFSKEKVFNVRKNKRTTSQWLASARLGDVCRKKTRDVYSITSRTR